LQAVGWALRPLPLLERCAWRYGDTFTLRVRHRSPWVVLSDPGAIKQVFTADAHTQQPSAVEASPTLGPLLGPRSVMLLDEPEHMEHRKRMLPAFHGARMDAYGEMVVEVARKEIASWPSGEQIALWPRMQAISSEVLLRSTFGVDASARLSHVREALGTLTAWLNDPRRLAVVTTVGPRWLSHSAGFRAAMDSVETAVLEEANRRRASGDPGEGILAMLEQGGRASNPGGRRMDERELRDELVTLLSDGPTSTSLAWAFERLLRHPEKLERLREEVARGQEETYADAVVKETLRLCPVVALIMRRLLAPLELPHRTIPAGVTVAPSPYLVHRREDIYPRARAFIPERFLASGERSSPMYAWIPFGGGVRRCVAASFAQLTIKRVLQTVLSEVQLRPAAGAASSETASRGSVAFAPGDHALAIVTRLPARPAARPRAA
jgi:cytochrome P450